MPYYIELDDCLQLFDGDASVICQLDSETFFQHRDALHSYSSKLLTASKKKGDSKHRDFLVQCTNTSAAVASARQKCVLEDSDKLRELLNHIVNVEKNIYAVSERLKELYRAEYESEVLAKASVCSRLFEQKEKLETLCESFAAKQAEDPEKSVVVPQLTKYSKNYPSKPVEPKAPIAPVLAEPGFFNKKRIVAENAMLTKEYESACMQYEEDLKAYRDKLTVYNEKIAQLQAEREKKRMELIEQAKLTHSEECEELKRKHLEAQQEYDQLIGALDTISTPQIAVLKNLKDEIAQAEELLVKLYQTKQQVQDSGVIFEKYNDFVAIASFYEYLCSGRCTSLEGPHGAYNLYESEIRMNAIVSQLGDVLKSLNQIQRNQFVIYTAINEATNELAALNKAARKINDRLTSMEGELSSINKNTAITAFYTKKNAELLDTLCFLTALN